VELRTQTFVSMNETGVSEEVLMTHSRTWLASAAVFALVFGIELPDPKLTAEHFPLPSDQTMAAGADRGLQEGQPRVQANDESAQRVF
jgi:hypothetical protein